MSVFVVVGHFAMQILNVDVVLLNHTPFTCKVMIMVILHRFVEVRACYHFFVSQYSSCLEHYYFPGPLEQRSGTTFVVW